MWFIIVTCRSLLWILSSIGTFMAVMYAMFTPRWLISKEQKVVIRSFNRTFEYFNTVGLYNRCRYSRPLRDVFCRPYARDLTEVSSIAWRCCLFLIGVALFILAIASILAVTSFCKQIIRRKSLMNLAGILQTIAGIFMIVVVILFPLGWDNDQIKLLCHGEKEKADKFQLGDCSIGLAYYCAIGGMVASFFCALFSFVADKAVFSPKVQDEILEGKQLICLF